MNTTSAAPNPAGGLGIFSNSAFQAGLGILIVMMLAYVAYSFLLKLRGSTGNDSEMAELLQKNFEEMRSEGEISEAEFRKIRASLSSSVSKRSQSSD